MRICTPIVLVVAASVWLFGIIEVLVERLVDFNLSDLPITAVYVIGAIMAIAAIVENLSDIKWD